MKSCIIVAAIIKQDNKILLGQKPKDIGPYPNTWHLPGGGVKLDEESLEGALQREIKEECGIEVDNIERVSFDEDYAKDKHGELTHYIFLVYQVRYKSGKVKSADDIEELQWFTKNDLKNIPLTRPSIKLFTELKWI